VVYLEYCPEPPKNLANRPKPGLTPECQWVLDSTPSKGAAGATVRLANGLRNAWMRHIVSNSNDSG